MSSSKLDPQRSHSVPMTRSDRQAWLESPIVQKFLKAVEATADFQEGMHGESIVLTFSPRSKLASILGGELEYANTRDELNSITTIVYYPGTREPFTVHKYDQIVFMGEGCMDLSPQMDPDHQTFLIHKTGGRELNCLCDPSFVACVNPAIRRYILPALE